jgi:hypothetical protein
MANSQTRPVELAAVLPPVAMSLGHQHSGGKLGIKMMYSNLSNLVSIGAVNLRHV